MLIIDRRFTNEMQKREFITECENDFLRMMESLTSSILENGDMRVVTLSGPTCSGKTVTAERISRAVEKAGRRMIRISIDDYYRDRSELLPKPNARDALPITIRRDP